MEKVLKKFIIELILLAFMILMLINCKENMPTENKRAELNQPFELKIGESIFVGFINMDEFGF